MKSKTATITVLLTLILLFLIPPASSQSLNLPSEGDIAQSSGEWAPWDRKDQVVQKWITLANDYGGSYESIGKSSSNTVNSEGYRGNSNWDIVLFKFGNPNGGKVMIDAHLHGNEYYGHEVLYNMIYWVLTSDDDYATRIRQNNYLLIVPCVCYRYGRTNYNVPSFMTHNDPNGGLQGVNLNRNFSPSWSSSLRLANDDAAQNSGDHADSEPESQALINAWNLYNPRIYWNLHQGSGSSTMCTARTTQAQTDANTARSLLSSIQDDLGISSGRWSFNVGSGYSNGFSKDGAASRGAAGFLTEVCPGWSNAGDIRSRLSPGGDLYNNAKAMLIAFCQAVETESPPPPEQWSITISSSSGGSTDPSGTRTVDVGQSLTVTAIPDSGYEFDSWLLDGSVFSSSITVIIPSQDGGSSHTLYAIFSEASTVTRIILSSGSITYGPPTYDISVNVNPAEQTAVNALSLGFQLDGRDIGYFSTRSTLQNLAEEANFKMVRFFHHRYGWAVSNWNSETMTGTWNWNNYDRVVNAIRGIGAEPLICLGYGGSGSMSLPSGMPRWSQDSYFPDPAQFAAYAREWVDHFRGEVTYWEILNEPCQHYFWRDSTMLARYFTFWKIVADEMRSENPSIKISHDATTVESALDYWIAQGEPLDFLGFHKYDSSNSYPADDELLFERAETETFPAVTGSIPVYTVEEARNVYGSSSIPVICGEANINWAFDPTDERIQSMTAAVWAALTIRYYALNRLDYWLWWDFAGSGSSQTKFGMVNLDNNQPWYPYYAMKMFAANSAVGDTIVQSSSSSSDVCTLAWYNGDKLNILIIYKGTGSPTIGLSGVSGTFTYQQLDAQHSPPQTGTINAQDTITLNGYTVMLLQQ